MVENHLKNRDPRPKRRKDKYNPYTIFTVGINTDSPRYYLSFTDSQNIHICMEIGAGIIHKGHLIQKLHRFLSGFRVFGNPLWFSSHLVIVHGNADFEAAICPLFDIAFIVGSCL